MVLVLLGFYFYSGSQMKSGSPTTVVEQSTTVEQTNTSVVKTPEKNSSTDEIVDYLVDGLSSDEKTTSKATIDGTSVPSQADAGASLNTNF